MKCNKVFVRTCFSVKINACILLHVIIALGYVNTMAQTVPSNNKVVVFGTSLDPVNQIQESKKLAASLVSQQSKQWRSKGDQLRKYHFPGIDSVLPYRLYVPTRWDGKSKLPLVMFLHGAWNDESSYLDADDKLMLRLAEQHGYILVAPLGYSKLGGYGTCLHLPVLFGKDDEALKMIAEQTTERWHTLELSEKDVINVLEQVLAEYPIDRKNVFLTGHSMGAGGTWYLGAKYADYWKALAPMSGPFVLQTLYPWDRIRKKPVLITEGTKTGQALSSSRQLADWMTEEKFNIEYKEVDADHGGMVPLVLPQVFEFFNRCRSKR